MHLSDLVYFFGSTGQRKCTDTWLTALNRTIKVRPNYKLVQGEKSGRFCPCTLPHASQVQENNFQKRVCTSGICLCGTLFFRAFQVLFPQTNGLYFMNNTLRGHSILVFHISNSILFASFVCCDLIKQRWSQ